MHTGYEGCGLEDKSHPNGLLAPQHFARKFVLMPTVLDNDNSTASDEFFTKFARKDSHNSSFENVGRKKLLPLLVQRIEQLPPKAKKILAMYYHEHLRLTEIANCFGLSEREIDDILTETIDQLKNCLLRVSDETLARRCGNTRCPK
jgi:RNA polymerase sigma factor (sigma-70 family)